MPRITAMVCILLSAAAASAQESGKRVALVIGNDAYSISPLKNAVNDATAMEKALSASGFKVVLVQNGKKGEMDEKIGEFLDSLGPDDTGLFFYAGHGVQIENENFLVPVDFTPGNSIAGAKFACISMARVFEELARKRAKRNIVILDACRSNPVAQKYSLAGGLAQPQTAGSNTFTAFSTSPGQVATDNPDGRNSWFTEVLSDLISQPKLTLELNELFTRVKKRVSDQTEGRQQPWTISSLNSDFYFHAPANQTAENDPTLVEKWMQDALRREQQGDWPEAIDKINQILNGKSGGALGDAAKRKLPYLMARQKAQESYEKSDFEAAAKLFDQALAQDPFALDAAFQGVNSYLLNSELPEAVRLLKAIRVRGTTASVERANRMLTELAKVSPEAGAELKAEIPQPPGMQEIFPSVSFGMPDWDGGNRVLRTSAVDVGRWVKEVTAEYPPPPPPPAAAAPLPALTPEQLAKLTPFDKAVFHVDIISAEGTRNLKIRKTGDAPPLSTSGVQRRSGTQVKIVTDPPGADLTVDGDTEQRCSSPCVFSLPPTRQVIHAGLRGYRAETRTLEGNLPAELQIMLEQDMGAVRLEGPQGSTPVLVDGETAAQQVPVILRLPVGKYQVRSVQDGKILEQQEIEVTAGATPTVQVKR